MLSLRKMPDCPIGLCCGAHGYTCALCVRKTRAREGGGGVAASGQGKAGRGGCIKRHFEALMRFQVTMSKYYYEERDPLCSLSILSTLVVITVT